MAVTPSFQELKNILKPMSWKDRVEYLWTYYKIVLVGLVGVAMLISIVATSIQNMQIQTLYSGILVSVQMEAEQKESVIQDLTALFEGDGNKKVVALAEVTYIPGGDTANLEMNNAAAMKITLLVAADSLDYILVDGDTYKELIQFSSYQDLRNVLSAEQQEMWKDHFLWKEAYEDTPSYPMALDITHTEFAKTAAPYEKELYLVFVGNPDHLDRDRAFVDYIDNWTK